MTRALVKRSHHRDIENVPSCFGSKVQAHLRDAARFRARSTSHAVAAPVAAAPRSRFRRAGLRKTRTILESGISGHGLLRFIYLDPPRTDQVLGDDRITLVYSLGSLHRNAFDKDTSGHVFPERDQ
jgi:hypothetical protein